MRLFNNRCLCGAIACFVGVALYVSSIDAAQYQLVGVDAPGFNSAVLGTSSLYDINTATGTAWNSRDTGVTALIGIATQPGSGQLFSLTTYGSTPWANSLLTLSLSTGTPSLTGSTGLASIGEGDLAFQPSTGVLYGVQAFVGGIETLFTVNSTTGAATIVGSIGQVTDFGDYSALAFESTGTLYTINNEAIVNGHVTSLLDTLDPNTGAISSRVPLSVSLGNSVGLAFDPVTGTAYVADGDLGTNNLYTLDTTTGVLTLVGPLGVPYGLSGLAFVPVPEPSSPALATIAAAALSLISCRRRRA
jgi:hypothetical protein